MSKLSDCSSGKIIFFVILHVTQNKSLVMSVQLSHLCSSCSTGDGTVLSSPYCLMVAVCGCQPVSL